MKQIFEKHPDIKKLSQYFKKIETIAENRGIDVDDLLNDPQFKKSMLKRNIDKNIQTLSKQRSETFSNNRISKARLKVLINH